MSDMSELFKSRNAITALFKMRIMGIMNREDLFDPSEFDKHPLLYLTKGKKMIFVEGSTSLYEDDDGWVEKCLSIYLQSDGSEIEDGRIGTVSIREREVDNVIHQSKIKWEPEKYIDIIIKKFNELIGCPSCDKIHNSKHKESFDGENNICYKCVETIFNDELNGVKNECAICLDNDCLSIYYKLKCNHSFHYKCLKQIENKKCPLCRKDFVLSKNGFEI